MGKRVVIPVRVSEPMRDAIDAARGDTPRSVWVEEAIAAKLGAPLPISIGGIKIPVTVDDRQPPSIVSVIAPGEAMRMARAFALTPEEAAPKTANCKHKGLRMAKGVCPECSTYVARKR